MWEYFTCCLGPSAPWPAHQSAVRKKMPATPVGMTEKKETQEHRQECLCHKRKARSVGGEEFVVAGWRECEVA